MAVVRLVHLQAFRFVHFDTWALWDSGLEGMHCWRLSFF
jgi:hypothetical protein